MHNTVSLTVHSLLFQAVDGTAIFSGHLEDGKSIRVVARSGVLPRQPVVGELWEIAGHYREHQIYGQQLYASSGKNVVPKGALLIQYLAAHPEFAGVGKTKAKALYDVFGDQLVDILNAGDADTLTCVVTSSLADRIISVWAEQQEDTAVIAFLDKYGFEANLANKLKKVWGANAIAMLERNPYYMLAFSSWKRVDAAAMKMNIPIDDSRRLVGAVEAVLYDRLQDGHTLTPSQMLQNRLTDFLGRWIDLDVKTYAIALALEENAIVGDKNFGYQPVGAAALEQRIAGRIQNMVQKGCSPHFMRGAPEKKKQILEEVVAKCESAQGFQLNLQQQQALHLVFGNAFSVVTGGAGVGKTTVLRVVNAVAKRLGISVIQMALAGRAAKRMTEVTKHDAITIARFLHQIKSSEFEIPSGSLIIIDEASMLDLPSTFRILSSLPDNVHVVFVGDAAQLPPVGFGLVFHQLVKSDVIPRVELTEVHRQAAETGIPQIAASVRDSIVPDLPSYAGKSLGVSFVDCDQKDILSVLERLSTDWNGKEFQILAATRQGEAGIERINTHFYRQNMGKKIVFGQLKVNDPVIHLRNDYDRNLMNGTLGHIVSFDGQGDIDVKVDFEGVIHSFSIEEVLEVVELAYAVSVHKAQGSQFQRVIVVVTKSRLFDHALVYTALTRGVEQVVFVGDKGAFEMAVRNCALSSRRQIGEVC
ncbi:AAA family ATPase [Halodesulfovibrio sp.]|uniref:AAA family ATPase n=1 Tax=Halodesulfovibrio sp. TaxID=1912772 RepID=UPI0025BC7041|nr:AAA family ATPase [Halodesulfovibrio sp.]